MSLPPEIQFARDNLENGQDRFWETPVNLRLSWFPEYLQTDLGEELLSNYGLLPGGSEIATEFWEEIEAIDKSFGEELPEEIKDWRKDGMKAVGKFMDYKLNRRSTVFSLWDSYGAPLRLKDSDVYRIWAPKDLMGSPIIKNLPIKRFL